MCICVRIDPGRLPYKSILKDPFHLKFCALKLNTMHRLFEWASERYREIEGVRIRTHATQDSHYARFYSNISWFKRFDDCETCVFTISIDGCFIPQCYLHCVCSIEFNNSVERKSRRERAREWLRWEKKHTHTKCFAMCSMFSIFKNGFLWVWNAVVLIVSPRPSAIIHLLCACMAWMWFGLFLCIFLIVFSRFPMLIVFYCWHCYSPQTENPSNTYIFRS